MEPLSNMCCSFTHFLVKERTNERKLILSTINEIVPVKIHHSCDLNNFYSLYRCSATLEKVIQTQHLFCLALIFPLLLLLLCFAYSLTIDKMGRVSEKRLFDTIVP